MTITKIVITGGSETTLTDAFTIFFEDYLGISSDADYLEDFTFTEEHEELEIQDNGGNPGMDHCSGYCPACGIQCE